jgi:alpha-tubulin suppressor-like RCC1 family protein
MSVLFCAHAFSIPSEASILKLVSKGYTTYALTTDGELYAWGYNRYGQVGNGSTENVLRPIKIGDSFTDVSAGYYHVLALKGADLYAWGWNGAGSLGDNTLEHVSKPKYIGTGFSEIFAGYYNSFALNGTTLYGWGYNRERQVLTHSTTAPIAAELSQKLELIQVAESIDEKVTSDYILTPTILGTGFTQVAAGMYHTLALKDRELYAWGQNTYGQLGDGTTTASVSPKFIGVGFTSISAGFQHSFALADTSLYVWGRNNFGQLGTTSTTTQLIPKLLGSGYSSIYAGYFHSLAIREDALFVWGYNAESQLGLNAESQVSVYSDADVTEASNIVSTPTRLLENCSLVSVGARHSHAVCQQDETVAEMLYGWGSSEYGQIGNSSMKTATTPVILSEY